MHRCLGQQELILAPSRTRAELILQVTQVAAGHYQTGSLLTPGRGAELPLPHDPKNCSEVADVGFLAVSPETIPGQEAQECEGNPKTERSLSSFLFF